MAAEKNYETITVLIISNEADYESLTGESLTVTAGQALDAFGWSAMIHIRTKGVVRVTRAFATQQGW